MLNDVVSTVTLRSSFLKFMLLHLSSCSSEAPHHRVICWILVFVKILAQFQPLENIVRETEVDFVLNFLTRFNILIFTVIVLVLVISWFIPGTEYLIEELVRRLCAHRYNLPDAHSIFT